MPNKKLPNVNLTRKRVEHHTRRRMTSGRNNHSSTDSHGGTLRASKDGNDAKNMSVVVVQFTNCKMRVYRENKYIASRVRTTHSTSQYQQQLY
jgi:hypothetical protein